MTNEEFQKAVLEELKGLKEGQTRLEGNQARLEGNQARLEGNQARLEKGLVRLEGRQTKLEEGQAKVEGRLTRLEEGQTKVEGRLTRLEEGQRSLEMGQKEIVKDLKAVIEQTANLTEFRTETNKKLDNLLEEDKSIHEILGDHEVIIRTLRRRIV